MHIQTVVSSVSFTTGGNHDYEAIENQVVTFDASTIRQTVAVSIREDDISEPQEFFFGQLSTPDPSTGVELFDTTANASIVDDASKFKTIIIRLLLCQWISVLAYPWGLLSWYVAYTVEHHRR